MTSMALKGLGWFFGRRYCAGADGAGWAPYSIQPSTGLHALAVPWEVTLLVVCTFLAVTGLIHLSGALGLFGIACVILSWCLVLSTAFTALHERYAKPKSLRAAQGE